MAAETSCKMVLLMAATGKVVAPKIIEDLI